MTDIVPVALTMDCVSIFMDYLKSILFISIVLFSNSISATEVCDNSCELTISFPAGGSIHAIEALTFTFGTGGNLNLGETGTINTSIQPTSTDFSSAGTLSLATGESITFDVNGELQLGTGGNLNYTVISIDGDGELTLSAIGGSQTLYLSTITATGSTALNFSAAAITYNALNITGDLFVNTSTSNNCISDSSTSSSTFYISGSTSNLTPNSQSECQIVDSDQLTESVTYSLDSNINTSTLLTVSITITVNGETCLPYSPGKCKTESGKHYELVDGEWVDKESAAYINLLTLFLITIIIAIRRESQLQINS